MRSSRSKFLVPLLLVVAVGFTVSGASVSSAQTGISFAPAFSAFEQNAYPAGDWLTAGGGLTDDRYSSLDQINTSNLSQLKVAWRSQFNLTKAKEAGAFGEEATPVVYQGTIFVPDAYGDVFAYDGATGRLLWTYHNHIAGKAPLLLTERGIGLGNGLVYMGTVNDVVVALNQQTGALVWRHELGTTASGDTLTAPPLYYNGMVVLGMSGGDIGARGFVVALNASTGQQLWKWFVTPAPGQPGSATWSGKEYLHSGSVWVYPSVDPQLGDLYVVTGNPVPWNGRGAGDDKWTDSIVALNIETGAFRWGFQTVHHDMWDYDVTNPPVIFNAVYNGQMEPAIAVASKTGWVYILNRATGKPLLPIPEVKVPQFPAGSAQEKYANPSPTQPEPVGDPLLNQCAQKSWWPGKAPDGFPYTVGCIFTPYAPSAEGSFVAVSPGAASIDWPPSSYDPQTGNLYVCANETHGGGYGAIPVGQQKLIVGSLYVGINFAFSKSKPAEAGRVIAVNLATNRIKWKDVFKTACYSGNLTTAAGLDFVGQINPRVLTALDVGSGKRLWSSQQMIASPMAPPITYMDNGKQYILVVAGGGGAGAGITGGTIGDSLYAFSLQ